MTELVTLAEPRSAAAEAYRRLRTNLSLARPDGAALVLLVTSAGAEADKSATLANLAVVTAQSGLRVVVVDADLRLPAQHRLFGLPNDAGLSTALAGDADLGAPPLSATSVDGLAVLTSGPTPPNPAELLGARRLGELLGRLAAVADVVLVDAPPLVAVTDAALVAPQVDGVLLVLAAGRSRRDDAVRARLVLDNVGAHLVGVVVTEVEAGPAGRGGYGDSGP